MELAEKIEINTIRENILSSFNSEKIGAKKTIWDIINEKGVEYKSQENLYNLYENEAEHLVRVSYLVKKNENLYVFDRNDEDRYFFKQAGYLDRIINFLNDF